MKLNLLALAFVAAAALAPFAARADDEVSFETFYDNLSPYGEWIQVGDYGDCWHPTGVDADWAPYTDGYWSYTDAGWTWVSYEDFGDICYHYGRWVNADEVGWCWVPDHEWGPAWVSWRQDDEYIGWAPLPPEARWRPSVGFSVWVDDYCDIGPSYYNFCPIVDFGAPVIRHVCVPRVTVVNIFARSVNITNISWNGYRNYVFCGGPNFTVINARLRRPIPTLKLVQNNTVINNNVTIIKNKRVVKFPRANVAGNTLNVFAPKVVNKDITNLNRPQITKVVNKEKVNHGWKLQDQGEVTKLREKVKSEAKGLNPDTAPAKPVQVADLKPVPEKADLTAPSPVAGRGDRRGKDRDGNDNAPDRGVADRPGKGPEPDRPKKIAGERPEGQPDAGEKLDRPGHANDPDKPNRGGKDNEKPKKLAGEKVDRENDNEPRNPRVAGNPLVKPFNEQKADRDPGDRGGEGFGKQKQDNNDKAGFSQAERQRQAAAEQAERQQRAAERQRLIESQQQQRQGGGNGPERYQRPPPQQQAPQLDPVEREQNQAIRQQQMERQAEQYQRQQQVQRQQQFQTQQQQRQFQQQRQPQRQQGGGGGGQGRQAPQQGQGDGQGGKKLSPEQREALKKQGF